MPLKVLIGVNLVQAFDRDTWSSSSLVTVPCAKTLLCRFVNINVTASDVLSACACWIVHLWQTVPRLLHDNVHCFPHT